LQHPPIQQNNTHIPFTKYSYHKLQSVTLQYILTQTYSRILSWKHTKIPRWCNIYKYPITNHVTSILHKNSYIKFTRLFVILRTISQLYLLYTKQLFPATCYCNDRCRVAFYPFLLAININIETTVMMTSLLLYLHHAVTALNLNLGTVV
jgi:hypothetical protein